MSNFRLRRAPASPLRRAGVPEQLRASPSASSAPNGQSAAGSAATADWAALDWDVIVIGGGNSAVTSAIAADAAGARVLILERSPIHMRGGNTRHTRNVRCVHEADDYNSGRYDVAEFGSDLCDVGEGPNDEELARFTVRESESLPAWMSAHGARWQQPLSGTLQLGRTNRFFLGGGKALLNSYYRYLAGRPGVRVSYDAKVEDFEFDGPRCTGLIVLAGGRRLRVRASAVVCASGGFEANLDWLRRYWADAVDNYIIRGTPYNDGHVLARLFAANAASAGQEKGFHAIALDARAPKFDGGIATRLDTIPFGIVVNRDGARFYDEGEDIWPKRYAIWGRNIADQPGQIAAALWDAKVNSLFLPPMYGVASSDDVGDLAVQLRLDPGTLRRTVAEYNAGVVPGGTFDPAVLDDCRTAGLTPPKSHWAQPLDRPPYYGIAMRPGITFTYMGVAVNRDAQVRLTDDTTFENVFAAGEMMSGNILSTGYLAGFGMTIGSVWGRHAGRKAAEYVHR
jgi:tricarballylate dehydrogenase